MKLNKSTKCALNFTVHLFILALFVTWLSVSSSAQESKTLTEPEIRALIIKSSSDDLKSSDDANEALSKLDMRAIPTLTRMLNKGTSCERAGVAGIILDLDPKNKNVLPVLVKLAKGGSIFSSENDLLCRRGATFLLGFYPEGIQILTGFLKDKDLFVRQSAIFAFDEITETANYPKGSLQFMKDAIPVLIETSKDKDEVLNCMGNEVLGQIMRGSDKELSEIAKRAVGQNK